MNKKAQKAFDELIEDAARETIMEMYRKALDISGEVYRATLVKMRETIDYELKKREERGKNNEPVRRNEKRSCPTQ